MSGGRGQCQGAQTKERKRKRRNKEGEREERKTFRERKGGLIS